MKTIVLMMMIFSAAGGAQTHTYTFSLPDPCGPGTRMLVQSKEDYLAVAMECIGLAHGKTTWKPIQKPKAPEEEEL